LRLAQIAERDERIGVSPPRFCQLALHERQRAKLTEVNRRAAFISKCRYQFPTRLS
jgi:hypothetical protein